MSNSPQIGYTPDVSMVIYCVDQLIKLWAENMKLAVENVEVPKFSGDDDGLIKACAFFSFARDAARKHAAGSTPTQLINWASAGVRSWAPPAWVLSVASKKFDEINKSIIQHHQTILKNKFDKLRDTYVDEIDKAASHFISSSYGKAVTNELYAWLKSRQFKDKADAISFTRCLMDECNFVEYERASVRDRVNSTFARTCKVVYQIYLGSNKGPAPWYASGRSDNDIFWESGSPGLVRGIGSSVQRRNRVHIKSTSDQVQMMAQAWRWTTQHYDNSNSGYTQDTTIVHEREGLLVDANGDRHPQRLKDSWVGPKLRVSNMAWAASKRFSQMNGGRSPGVHLGGANDGFTGSHPGIMVRKNIQGPLYQQQNKPFYQIQP